jgi:phage-related protein
VFSSSSESWTIEFYLTANGENPVQAFIDDLSLAAQASVLRDLSLLRDYGLAVGFPTVRPMEGIRKLWELRVKTKDGAVRIFYVARTGRRFVLLHAFLKKSNKTPKSELNMAIKRLKQILAEGA